MKYARVTFYKTVLELAPLEDEFVLVDESSEYFCDYCCGVTRHSTEGHIFGDDAVEVGTK